VDFDIPYTDFGARLYAPNLGRWITPDPESEKYYDFSPYAYCANDPVNMVDPDGKCWEILLGMVVEYGFQVYDNYKEGDTGYNLWLGNVDLAEVGLSAINPTKKGKLVFTLLVEVGKEVISYSLKEGVSFNDDIEEVIKNATVNTVVDRAVGAFFKQGSKKAAETAKREAREASIKTGRAQRKAARRPNSTKAAREAKDAVINEKNARKREVTTRSINAVKVFEGSTATTIQHLNNYEEEQEEK